MAGACSICSCLVHSLGLTLTARHCVEKDNEPAVSCLDWCVAITPARASTLIAL